MSLQPKVTVYIATHNRKNLLVKALGSVIAQTYQTIEIIIINDGSSDNTKDVIDALLSIRVMMLYYFLLDLKVLAWQL